MMIFLLYCGSENYLPISETIFLFLATSTNEDNFFGDQVFEKDYF